jgi:curved DNA-binding protein CbpA
MRLVKLLFLTVSVTSILIVFANSIVIFGEPYKLHMLREDALRILGVSVGEGASIDLAHLRKRYLRACLSTHPDKNKDDAAASQKFTELKQAYDLLVCEGRTAATAEAETARTASILELLMRALQGEDVEKELTRLGIHRPSTAFGVDLTVPFLSGSVARASIAREHDVDVREAFREAFEEDGMDEEGNPLQGWARPPVVDVEDL